MPEQPWSQAIRAAVDQVLDDGYAFFPGLIPPTEVEAIRGELAPWMERPAVGCGGYIPSAGDRLLTDVGLYSPSALALAVDDGILDLMEGVFGTPTILFELSCRRRVAPAAAMPWHSDADGGVIVFVYLNGVSSTNGSTCVIPRTHEFGTTLNDGHLQVPANLIDRRRGEMIFPEGPAGSVLVFDQDIWHGRTAVTTLGRELLWLTYHSDRRAAERSNTYVAGAAISAMSERQRAALLPRAGAPNIATEFFHRAGPINRAVLDELPLRLFVDVVVRRGLRRVKATVRPIVNRFRKTSVPEYRKKTHVVVDRIRSRPAAANPPTGE